MGVAEVAEYLGLAVPVAELPFSGTVSATRTTTSPSMMCIQSALFSELAWPARWPVCR